MKSYVHLLCLSLLCISSSAIAEKKLCFNENAVDPTQQRVTPGMYNPWYFEIDSEVYHVYVHKADTANVCKWNGRKYVWYQWLDKEDPWAAHHSMMGVGQHYLSIVSEDGGSREYEWDYDLKTFLPF